MTMKSPILTEEKSALNIAPNVVPNEEKLKLMIPLGMVEYIPISRFGTYNPSSSQSIPKTQVAIIPKRIPPFTFLISKTAVIRTPIKAKIAVIPTDWNVAPLKV